MNGKRLEKGRQMFPNFNALKSFMITSNVTKFLTLYVDEGESKSDPFFHFDSAFQSSSALQIDCIYSHIRPD